MGEPPPAKPNLGKKFLSASGRVLSEFEYNMSHFPAMITSYFNNNQIIKVILFNTFEYFKWSENFRVTPQQYSIWLIILINCIC